MAARSSRVTIIPASSGTARTASGAGARQADDAIGGGAAYAWAAGSKATAGACAARTGRTVRHARPCATRAAGAVGTTTVGSATATAAAALPAGGVDQEGGSGCGEGCVVTRVTGSAVAGSGSAGSVGSALARADCVDVPGRDRDLAPGEASGSASSASSA